ncbi:Uncharacterized protein OBRU01_10723 [Operophtera brumata]|uniref:Uncharacterized protein n=1 Tax=Operophtera brumata TaxID=104452 RepID=A0A0L7LDI0_OPEBR|nr:Uncharacterized protein OBRU01_10723 [Operophtera brumata]
MFKVLVLTVAVVAYAEAYSSGAPDTACQDMIPRHPVAAQKSPAPYSISTSTKNAITHKKHDAQFDKQTVSYTATIALNGAVFWVGVESAPVKVTN